MAREASVGRPGVDEHPAPPGPARSRSFVTYAAAAVVSEVAMTSRSRSGGSFAARTCIALARAATVIPHQGQRQRHGPQRLHQVGAGPFADDLEQHPPGHARDDLVAEIGAGGCLGDVHEGCHGTDLPGDQLTFTSPIQVHAGRGELLREHVDLAVEPPTPGHVASLPSLTDTPPDRGGGGVPAANAQTGSIVGRGPTPPSPAGCYACHSL